MLEDYTKNVGKMIKMKDGSSFFDQSEVKKVKSVVVNPENDRPAYSFDESDVLVNCDLCSLAR